MLPQVIQKVKKDKAKVVLVCPDWKYSRWWKAVQWFVVGDVFFPKGTKVFDCPDRPKLPATRWGTWVYLLDGSLDLPKEIKPKKIMQACVFSFVTRQAGEQEEERVEEFRRKVMEEYQGTVLTSILSKDPPKRGPYGHAKSTLKDGAIPMRQKPFMLHGEKAEAHKKVVQEWLDNGYLELAEDSEWLSMTFPVPKKNPGEWRGVVDMRGPNTHTRPSTYPLPVIEDLLVKQGGKHIFSIFDLKQAFHQQPLETGSRPITACWTPFGIYQWKVNVMGLRNAPQQFQEMIDWVLTPVNDVASAYIDNIVVRTEAKEGEDLLEKHLQDVCRVLNLLREQKLVVDPKKCQLFTREVEFCGHVLAHGTRKPMPKMLNALERWETPKTVTQLRAFLGFTNYYAIYIPGYAQLAAPLQEKFKGLAKWESKKRKHKTNFLDSRGPRNFR